VTDLRLGDCTEVLRTLPAGSVHTCVTSPPYFGLRDYGADGQIGLERTPDEYVARMVAVFREVRRVLRDDATLWLNLGDSYATNPGNGRGGEGSGLTKGGKTPHRSGIDKSGLSGLKTKDLIGIPWMVAFALRADGWYLRSDIIWHKPNPMPESVRDRPTKAHEYLFLLSKSATYHYDADAVREPLAELRSFGGEKTVRCNDTNTNSYAPGGTGKRCCGMGQPPLGRNRRSVFSAETVHAKLRSDLSPKQKSYIIGELIQRGLL
jgi:DNA modification methylase